MFTKNTQYTFSVIIEHDEDGYIASCPELTGCYTQGETYEETIKKSFQCFKNMVLFLLAKTEAIKYIKTQKTNILLYHFTTKKFYIRKF